MTKIDDVAWHLDGDSFSEDLPEANAATHIGCFVAWAIKRGLWDVSMFGGAGKTLDAVAQGQMSGRDFVLQECDGKLLSQMLVGEGEAFARKCYDPYIKEYRRLLVRGLSSDYLVEDNLPNQEAMEAALDLLFHQWKLRPWWKPW